MESTTKRDNSIWPRRATVLFGVLLAAYSVLMYVLYYRQATHTGEWFMSDIDAYLQEMQGIDSGFDFPYPIYFAFSKWLGALLSHTLGPVEGLAVGSSVALTILNSLSVVALVYFMHLLLTPYYEKCRHPEELSLLTILLTFAMFFVSMLYAPKGVYLPGMDHKYLGVFSPNPLHNQTYMATRPFSIVAFFLFARILSYYEAVGRGNHATDSSGGIPVGRDMTMSEPAGRQKATELVRMAAPAQWKQDYFLFGLFLFLTTMTKPSFTLVLGSCAFIILLVKFALAKGRTLRANLYLGLTFVPTVLVLLYQFGGVFGSGGHAGEDGGIGFGIGAAWSVYTHNIVLAIMLGMAFPGFFLLCNLKKLKSDPLFRFTWIFTITGFLEFLCLFEKGDRFIHMNFCWGYMHAMFFAFAVSIICLVQNTIKRSQHILVLVAEWLILAWHLFCGVIYFLYIYSGQFYYSF